MIALFFDTETTGFKSSTFTPEIVQIGAILQDTETRRVLAELNVIIKAKDAIPPRVSEIHGITDELAQRFGVESTTAESMFSLMVIMVDIVVAHNIKFDLEIIAGVWPAASAELTIKQQYCTMIEAESRVGLTGNHAGGTKYPKLIEAYRHFYGKEFDNQHDAMADVRACRDVYFALYDSLEAHQPEPDLKAHILNLIEQSKDKDLPLHWLAGEINKL
jgi:DNA polymerase-3 subunit epsilon